MRVQYTRRDLSCRSHVDLFRSDGLQRCRIAIRKVLEFGILNLTLTPMLAVRLYDQFYHNTIIDTHLMIAYRLHF